MTETETREVILAAINELPEEERKILALHYGEGLSLDEIAEVLYPEIEADKEDAVYDKR